MHPSRLAGEQRATVRARFENQVALTPDTTAVAFGQDRMTYAELDARADRIARWLRAKGARRETVIGICLDRCLDLVIAVLGVIKSDACYLPLDPAYPPDRLSYMVAAADATIVVTRSALVDSLGWLTAGQTATVMTDAGEVPSASERKDSDGTAENLLYVIYTSGSSGRPKGVAVPNRALLNLFDWYSSDTNMAPGDVQLSSHSFSFDPASLEILFPLLHGAELVLAPEPARFSPDELLDVIAPAGVTVINVVPSLLYRLLEEPEAAARMSSLRLVVCGGEKLSPTLRDRFLEALPGTRLVNHYGPTETTIFATSWDCQASDGDSVPIGRPVAGVQAYIVGDDLEPLPPGSAGELCVGGSGLARCYANSPRLTAQAFVPDPFRAAAGARMYRTGDQARLRPDGVLEFLGRIDEQVQLRGHRVELAEIEAAIARHAGVREAAVVVRTGNTGDDILAGFAEHDGSICVEQLRAHLRTYLPDYMVPAYLELVGAFPRTVSGKVDKARLPVPPTVGTGVRPRNSSERAIADIWASVLGLAEVGVYDDFFALGGDSLLAMRMMTRVRRELGVTIPLIAAFEHRCVAALADLAETALASVETQPAGS